MMPYIPVRAKIFHMLPDLVGNLRSLIASQYAEADRAICGRGRHDGSLTVLHRPESRCWEETGKSSQVPTAQNKKQKL